MNREKVIASLLVVFVLAVYAVVLVLPVVRR